MSGPFEIFVADAGTSSLGALDPVGPPPVPLFNPAPEFAPTGTDPSVIGDLYSLGEFGYLAADAGTVDSFSLQFGPAARAVLDSALANDGTIRLVIAATDEPVALFYDGVADGPAGDGPLQTPGGIEPLLTAVYLPTLDFPGDLNGDGRVDLLDLDILGMNFGLMGGRDVLSRATSTATATSTCSTSTSWARTLGRSASFRSQSRRRRRCSWRAS